MKLKTVEKVRWADNNDILMFVKEHRETDQVKSYPHIAELLKKHYNINISYDVLRISYNRYKRSITEDPKTLKNRY